MQNKSEAVLAGKSLEDLFNNEIMKNKELMETLNRSCSLLATAQQKIVELQKLNKSKSAEISNLKQEITELRAHNEILQQEKEKCVHPEIEEKTKDSESNCHMEKQMDELKKKCTQFEGLSRYWESEFMRVKSDYQKLEQNHKKEVHCLEQTIKALNTEISDFTYTDARHQREIEVLRLSASNSRMELETLKAEVTESKQQFSIPSDTIETVFSHINDIFSPVLEKCDVLSEKISTILKKSSDSEKSIHSLEDKLRDLETEKQLRQQQNAAIVHKVEKLEQDMNSQFSENTDDVGYDMMLSELIDASLRTEEAKQSLETLRRGIKKLRKRTNRLD